MDKLTLSDWSSIAQLLITIFTVIGVIASLYLSTKALREVQIDRRQRQTPHLAFETGGYRYPIRFVKAGKRIPGINPKTVELLFPNLPEDAESIRLDEKINDDGKIINPIDIGVLKNYGSGPALSTNATWIPLEVWIGNEEFKLDEKKLSEPVYSTSLNNMPTVPTHILPNEKAGLPRLPTFIEKDIEKKLTKVKGMLRIEATDVFGNLTQFQQEFYLFTNYKEGQPWIHVTFSDLILNGRNNA